MPYRIISLLGIALIAIGLSAYEMPKNWFAAGSKPECYDMGVEQGAGQNGGNAATIRSVKREINGFGTMMQNFSPEKYKGKRLRFTGYIKANDVEHWAGLWMRVDGERTVLPDGRKKHKTLAFDNMYNRSISGTQDYTKCEIVLDVADTATNIAYGALLNGTGQIWFDRLNFAIVDKTVPVTTGKLTDPTNLDFGQ